MSAEVLSVEGQLVGMPLAGPESFSLVQLNYLKNALGVDETTLYESDAAVAQGDTFSLSETPANFRTIKIYIAHGANATNWATVLEYPGDVTRYDIILPATDNATNMIIDRFYFSRSGTTVTVGARKRHTIGASSVSSTDLTNPAFIMKVVGIDRISGGN